FTGSVLVGTIATLHGYQAHKDHRHEAKDLRSRLNALSYELTQTQRLKDGLETRQQALQSQLTETTQQAQSATAALEPMQKRVVVAEAAVAALNASEKSLID
ncbi:hypothetical protein, partial [Haemophilus parainfluenzae]|uniref:hypothetical protein n=1 Tax=Haemophilus parainfluenzae TaxID=729 RepID=UPI001788B8AF